MKYGMMNASFGFCDILTALEIEIKGNCGVFRIPLPHCALRRKRLPPISMQNYGTWHVRLIINYKPRLLVFQQDDFKEPFDVSSASPPLSVVTDEDMHVACTQLQWRW